MSSFSQFTGFVGLGIMGKGMAKNLITKFPERKLLVWNRSVGPSQELAAAFPGQVTIAHSPADVVRQSDITYSMLSDMNASMSVFDDPIDGIIAGVSAGKVIVDCATLSPERMMDECAKINEKGGMFLEAPVSGSKVPAETGQLIFLCGGSQEVFTLVTPALEAMGKANFYFGQAGQGCKVKLVVNMIMGTMMSALADGVTLAQAADLPIDKLLQVLSLGAMTNPMFQMKGPNMINNTFAPHFPLKHAQKDMQLALNMSKDLGVVLPTSAASNEEYLKTLERHGDDDFSAVYRANK